MEFHSLYSLCPVICSNHYSDVIMGVMASQITGVSIVYPNAYSATDPRKHQSFASLGFVRGIHRWSVNSPHKGPVTRRMFPFYDVIMSAQEELLQTTDYCPACWDVLLPCKLRFATIINHILVFCFLVCFQAYLNISQANVEILYKLCKICYMGNWRWYSKNNCVSAFLDQMRTGSRCRTHPDYFLYSVSQVTMLSWKL